MKIRILACAEQELAEVVDYYNGQALALGFEFAAEVKTHLNGLLPIQMLGHFSQNGHDVVF